MKRTIDIDKLAELARLELSEEEKTSFGRELCDILRMAEKLSEIDTDGLSPAEHVLPLYNVFREDVPHPFDRRDALLAAASTTAEGCVTVPRVLENERDAKGQEP